MSWRTEWKSLSDRIASLLDAGKFSITTSRDADPYRIYPSLIESAKEVFKSITEFKERYASLIPPFAASRLSEFIQQRETTFTSAEIKGSEGVRAQLALLVSFRSEFTQLLANTEAVARSLVDRAFLHLQRSIIADPSIAQRWREAFKSGGETECEKLGAVHLLLHGIWAFKASAEGERTDLVLGNRLEIKPHIEGASEALVLTEWKRVSNQNDLCDKAEQAYRQAKRYALGSLAGFELASRRYLVMVSEDELDMPDDKPDVTVTYQHVNVAVNPKTPSGSARQRP